MLEHPQATAVNMEAEQSVLDMAGQMDSETHTCRACPAKGDHTTERSAMPCFLEIEVRPGPGTEQGADLKAFYIWLRVF